MMPSQDKDKVFAMQNINLDAISSQQTDYKNRLSYSVRNKVRMAPHTQRCTRPHSRVELNADAEDGNTIRDDLSNFEQRVNIGSKFGPASNYPNIELKRCFDAQKFRNSNREITSLRSTRAGSLRSHVQTCVPMKHRTNTGATSQH